MRLDEILPPDQFFILRVQFGHQNDHQGWITKMKWIGGKDVADIESCENWLWTKTFSQHPHGISHCSFFISNLESKNMNPIHNIATATAHLNFSFPNFLHVFFLKIQLYFIDIRSLQDFRLCTNDSLFYCGGQDLHYFRRFYRCV